MPPKRTTIPIDHDRWLIQVTDDDSRTLIDPRTQVAFHSASGAVAETRHVYLRNSGVCDRLTAGLPTSVLEIGLGTGMALLQTLDLALTCGTPLRYTAIENDWLPAAILRRLELGRGLTDQGLAAQYLDWRQSLGSVVGKAAYRWQGGPEQEIEVLLTDVLKWHPSDRESFDAIYFDPFAPDADPQLWKRPLLETMHGLLRPGGRLVTYCVQRPVRENFAAAGFTVSRVRGPVGGKREVLVAAKSDVA